MPLFFSRHHCGKTKGDEQPELASWVNATDIKSCIYWLAHVCNQMKKISFLDRVVEHMVWSRYCVARLVDTSPMWLSLDIRIQLQMHVSYFLQAYQYLSSSALVSGQNSWDLRPKFHYLDHASADLDVINSNWKVTGCWDSEKWLGKIKSFCKSTSSGKSCSLRGLQRYTAFLKLRFKNRSEFKRREI